MIVESSLGSILTGTHDFISSISEQYLVHIHQQIITVAHCAAPHGMIFLHLVVLQFSTLCQPTLHRYLIIRLVTYRD